MTSSPTTNTHEMNERGWVVMDKPDHSYNIEQSEKDAEAAKENETASDEQTDEDNG